MALVSPAQAPARVTAAIQKASDATGTNFDYLLTTAARESNFKPHAKAKTSSAAGLFQFIESTWLQTVKEQGGRYGLEKYSPHIFQTESGRFVVPNKEIRSEILALRHNPEVSALMAGAFTQQNADYVGSRLGREPTQGELYIAHFLGASGATKLITLASKDPNARADTHFPRAANANKPIFYSHRQARSVRQVYDQLVKDHSQFGAMTLAVSSPIRSRPPEAGMAVQAKAISPLPSGNVPEVMPASMMIKAGEKQYPASVAQAVPPVSRTRVAALAHSAIPVNGTMTDAGLGGIGSWHTIVLRDAARSPAEPATSTPEPDLKPAANAASGPSNVPLHTRLHSGAPAGMAGVEAVRSAPSRAEAPQTETATARARGLPNFFARFWELQVMHGG